MVSVFSFTLVVNSISSRSSIRVNELFVVQYRFPSRETKSLINNMV